jgi:ribosomal protein L18E
MSRGPGELQKAVLTLLSNRGPLPISTIAWEVALDTNVVSPDDNIGGEVYNNITRATRKLALGKDARLKRTEGSFLTLDDLVERYPDRTKVGIVRNMRRQLLHHIKGYLKQHAPRPAIETENVVLGPSGSSHRAAIASRWSALEPLLLRELPRSDGDVTVLLQVLTRGRAILGSDRFVSCDMPLLTSAPRLAERLGKRASRLRRLLEDLCEHLPIDEFKRSRLKAFLRGVALFERYGAPTLKRKFLDYLYKHEASFLRGLEGHRETNVALVELVKVRPPDFTTPDRAFVDALDPEIEDPSPEYSPLVHKLLDKSAFKPFPVYSLRLD